MAASSSCGSTWTTTSLPGRRFVQRFLDLVCGRVALADGGARRDTDHDVHELPWPSLAHAQPAEGDRRLDAGDRRARSFLGVCRGAVHQDVDVPLHQPDGRERDEDGDEERRC